MRTSEVSRNKPLKKVLVADDHTLFIGSLVDIVSKFDMVSNVFSATSKEALFTILGREFIDIMYEYSVFQIFIHVPELAVNEYLTDKIVICLIKDLVDLSFMQYKAVIKVTVFPVYFGWCCN